MMNNDLAIVTCGFLPVPATKGGAVENLIENFLNRNEIYKKLSITVFSIFDADAKAKVFEYERTNFIFIKPIFLSKILDTVVYFIAAHILHLNKTVSYRFIFQRLSYISKVSKWLNKNNYQKILLENNPTLLMTLKKKKNFIKYANRYYHHIHNEITNTYGCGEILKNAKSIICVSNYIVNRIRTLLDIQNITNLSVLRNCIDQTKFTQALSEQELQEIKAKYNIKNNEKVLLFTGRLTKEKGIKELLLALKNVENTDYKLLIAGGFFFCTKTKNTFEKELNQIIGGLTNKIIFTGYISYNEMFRLYAISDIAVLPSIWEDPAPLTVIEALSCGLPIITTNSGGIPEYVNEKCAFILNREDKNFIFSLSKSLDTLLTNETLRQKMGVESLLTAKDLTLDNYYFNFLHLLDF